MGPERSSLAGGGDRVRLFPVEPRRVAPEAFEVVERPLVRTEDVHLDYIDVVIHIQHAEEREFYALDKLWKDCPTIEFVDRDLAEADASTGAA